MTEDEMTHFNETSTWIIVFPRGERSRLSVVEICEALHYEKADYAIASREEFYGDPRGAHEYAKQLAAENGLIYEHDGVLD